MQEIKASWEMDHDQAQNKSLSLDWPRGRSMKFFISKLKNYLFFLLVFVCSCDVIILCNYDNLANTH